VPVTYFVPPKRKAPKKGESLVRRRYLVVLHAVEQ
jgi:hypothetical protein